MKIDFRFDMTAGGKYPHADPVNLVRIFDFTLEEGALFAKEIDHKLLGLGNALQVDQMEFVESINCTLRFELCSEDLGMALPSDQTTFICRLTRDSYINMLDIINRVSDGFNWLYDPKKDEQVDILFSSGGTW